MLAKTSTPKFAANWLAAHCSVSKSILATSLSMLLILGTEPDFIAAQNAPVPSTRSTLGSPYTRPNGIFNRASQKSDRNRSSNDQPIVLSEFAIPEPSSFSDSSAASFFLPQQSPATSSTQSKPPAFVWLKEEGEWTTQLLLRKVVKIDGPIAGSIQVDGKVPYQVFCNGRVVGEGDATTGVQNIDVTNALRHGDNVIAVQAKRETAEAPGVGLRFQYNTSVSRQTVETDSTWLASKRALPLWKTHLYSDRSWTEAAIVGSLPVVPSNLPAQTGLPVPAGLMASSMPSIASPQSNKQGLEAKNSPASSDSDRIGLEQVPPTPNKNALTGSLAVTNAKNSLGRTKEAPIVSAASAVKPEEGKSVSVSLADKTTPETSSNSIAQEAAIAQVPPVVESPADPQFLEATRNRIYPTTQATALSDNQEPNSAKSSTLESMVQKDDSTATNAGNSVAQITDNKTADYADDQTKSISPTSFAEPAANPLLAEVGDDSIKLRVPEGFVVEPVASSDIGSLIAIEFDEFGRLIASKEQGGLVRIDLTVPVSDPKRVTDICTEVTAVQGILPLNGSLYVTGLGPEGLGLYRLDDTDGDFKHDSVNKICGFTGEPGEHGPHAVNLGPDRMLYILLGNHSQIEGDIAANSLVKHFYEGDLLPRYEDPSGHAAGIKAPGGTLVRMSLDGSTKEIVAAGIRNAYDFAFDANGEIFFHDSDMESDEGTSWYRPTAFHHVIGGGDYGWRSGWGKWRTHYPDSIAPIAVTGRASPSGNAFYQHVHFPSEYQNQMFLADWSNGRIVSVALEPNGASFKGKLTTFMEGRPLNVTDLSVGPEDGALYVALGGRGSTGGVYRVRWTGETSKELTKYNNGWEEVIRAPLFYSAASRQRIASLKQELSESWDKTMYSIVTSEKNVDAYRIRGLDVLQWFGPTPDLALLTRLSKTESIAVRAKTAKILGTLTADQAIPVLIEMMMDESPQVQRCVCESLSRLNAQVPAEKIVALMDSPDRTVAYVAGRLLEKQPFEQWRQYLNAPQTPDRFVHLAVTTMTVEPTLANAYNVLVGVTKHLDSPLTDSQKLDLLRVTELALGRGNVEPDKVPVFVERLAKEFPSDNSLVNRELIYILTYLNANEVVDAFTAYLNNEQIAYIDRWHLAMHVQLMGEKLPSELRSQLIHFLEHARSRDAGGSYAHYVMQATRNLASHISAEEAQKWIGQAKECPDAALIALSKLSKPISLEVTKQLAQLDLELAGSNDPASKDLRVGIVAVLGETLVDGDVASQNEASKALLAIWERDPNRRQWVALAMSQCPIEPAPAAPKAEETNAALLLASQARTTLLPVEGKRIYADRFASQLIESLPYLTGSSASEVLVCLDKLKQDSKNPAHIRNIILLGVRYPETASAAHQLLTKWTAQVIPSDTNNPAVAMASWQSWFQQRYPQELPAALPSSSDVGKWTVAEIEKQLSLLKGDSANGQLVYQTAKCASCHKAGSVGSSVGPDLNLVTGRFTRREILESIVHPSQVISDQYRSDVIQTEDGKIRVGIVSQLPGAKIAVLDSEGKRTELNKIDVVEIKRSTESIMPTKLLESLNAQEIVDLIAFLEKEDRDEVAAADESVKR